METIQEDEFIEPDDEKALKKFYEREEAIINRRKHPRWYDRVLGNVSFKLNKQISGKVLFAIGFITSWHVFQILYTVLFIINIVLYGIIDWASFIAITSFTAFLDIFVIIFCSLFSVENQTGIGALVAESKKILKKKEPLAIRMKRMERLMDNITIQWNLLNEGAPMELKVLRKMWLIYTKNNIEAGEKLDKIGEELGKVLDPKI